MFVVSCSDKVNNNSSNGSEKEDPEEISVLTFKRSSATDTEMIQKAVDYASANRIPVVTIPDGNYEIDATVGIVLKDNTQLQLSENTILKALPNSSTHYAVIKISNIVNAKVTGGTIIGERYEHTGSGGEWGHGIDIRSSINVELKDITIKDCWGDGLEISGAKSKNIRIDKVTCDNNRRQGISVCAVDGLIIKNSSFTNTNGTPPESGICLEPFRENEIVKNVFIDSCSFIDNKALGLHMYGKYGPVRDVKATNCWVDNNPIGVSARYEDVANIEITNFIITNSVNQSLRIFDGSKDVEISQVEIMQSGKNGITIANGDNVTLSDFLVDGFSTDGILIDNSSNVKLVNFTFKNPTSSAVSIRVSSSQKISIADTEITDGKIGVSATTVERLSLSNSAIKGQSEDGLFLNSSNNSIIKENTLNQVAMFPIRVSSSNNNTIHGNSFNGNCFLTNNTYSQVYFLGTSRENEFYDNTINDGNSSNKAKYAIWLAASTRSNKVYNNHIDNNSFHSDAINDESENNQVE